MLRKQFKMTTVQNLHILLEQSVHILLMFFVLNTILSTSSFVRERLGITAKSREVTETTKNVSTIIWVSIPLLICKNRWGCYLRRSNGIPMAVLGWKSPNQKHKEPEIICAWLSEAFAFFSRGFAPPSECKSIYLNSLLVFFLFQSHIIDKTTESDIIKCIRMQVF